MFMKKTEGATAVVEPNEVDELQRQIGPLKTEIVGLETRLREERKRQVKLRTSYDKACVAADTAPETYLSPHVVRHMNYRRRRLKTEYETVSGLIAGLETTLAEKVSQLQQ